MTSSPLASFELWTGLFGGLALYYGFLHIIGLSGPVNLPAFILGMASSTGMPMTLLAASQVAPQGAPRTVSMAVTMPFSAVALYSGAPNASP